ncbi:MAG: hypothetical protein KTR35_01000 [Gammaproteobacteria bacterium]|nr:hypothetical protein [Gammaproteobacteria bacterium]
MLDTLSEELKQTRAFEDQMREFGAIVTKNDDIQKKLSDAVDDGISSQGFCELYVSTAAANGIEFTVDQMKIAMHEQKQGSDKVLPSFVQKLITIL